MKEERTYPKDRRQRSPVLHPSHPQERTPNSATELPLIVLPSFCKEQTGTKEGGRKRNERYDKSICTVPRKLVDGTRAVPRLPGMPGGRAMSLWR